MKHLSFLWLTAFAALAAGADERSWQPTTWHGESAFESRSGEWRAIVSVTRARLVHFGPADSNSNLLYEVATREDIQGWGGHRVWLGPQADWPSGGWPPPAEWEKTAAYSASVEDGVLTLAIPPAGHGWPAFNRTYHWTDDGLVCGIDVLAGGGVPAQIIQILQVPTAAVVDLQLQPDENWPEGYAGLRVRERMTTERLPAQPAHATVADNRITLRHTGAVEKLGFRPQPIHATIGEHRLSVGRGKGEGTENGRPDEGFFTQVYLGDTDTFIELEQLSPLWAPGTEARFEIVVRGEQPTEK